MLLSRLLCFYLPVFCFGCRNVTGSNKLHLVVDTVKAEFDFQKCIEASEPTYGFVLASDSVFFLAYITETKKLKIKSVFDHSYDFTADISALTQLSPDTDLIISYEKDSFYFFIVDSACYYVLPFDDLKKRKHRRLIRRQPDFLNYFTSVAYYSTGSDPPVLIHENLLIVPYRLRTAANENLVDTYAYCLIDSFRCARPVLHRCASFPAYAYEHYDGLVNQVYFLNRKRNQFYFTNKNRIGYPVMILHPAPPPLSVFPKRII